MITHAPPQPTQPGAEPERSPGVLRRLAEEIRELAPTPQSRRPVPEIEEHTVELRDLEAAPLVLADGLSVLDHRARARSIPRRLAPPGAYLAFDGAGEDGEATTRLVPLSGRITHLGRGSAADLCLEDRRISRDHAIVVRHGRRARVLDNRSSNGTFVNGRRVVATNLADGDEIRIGPLVLRYLEIR